MLNLPAGKPDLGAGLGRAAGMRQQPPHGLHIARVTEFAEFAGEGPTAAEGCRCGLSAMRFWRLACSLSEFEKVRAAINTWRTPCSRPMYGVDLPPRAGGSRFLGAASFPFATNS